MRRTSNFLIGIGLFLLVSLLWPYDPEEPAAGPSTHGSRASREPSSPAEFEFLVPSDEWGGVVKRTIFSDSFNFNVGNGYRERPFSLPDGVRIPPGTRWLNFTVETTALDGSSPPVDLWVTTANDVRRHFKLEHGIPVATRVSDEWADWTADPDSRWRWSLGTSTTGSVTGRLRIDISRDGPLPGPQYILDRWRDRNAVRVFDQRAQLMDFNPAGQETSTATSQPQATPRLRLQPATGVEQLFVELRYNSSTPTEFHYQPFLWYRGADKVDTWEKSALPPAVAKPAAENGYFLWRLPVEPRMWDSPFAQQTRWQVHVNWYGSATDSPTLMQGDFQFTIDAKRDPPRA
ncbi:MAG: hypothetical protein HYT80_02530 [Euryarchaeota archaeon]|nr:hypothetical protein [Euryarchaeota archaeon]